MNNETVIPEGCTKANTNSPARLVRLCPFARIPLALPTAAAVLFAIQFSACRTPTQNLQQLRNQRIGQTGDSTVRLTGKTEAVESRAILAPVLSGQQVGTLTIVKLIPSGSRVKRGEILVEFDRSAQVRDVIDKKAQADDQDGKALEAIAAENAAKAKDETDIEQAETALTKAELEMQKVELLSRIDAEKAREDLDEARATLAQLKTDVRS